MNDNNMDISWDDASQSSEGLGILFWDDVSIGEGGSAHGSLNSLRGLPQSGNQTGNGDRNTINSTNGLENKMNDTGQAQVQGGLDRDYASQMNQGQGDISAGQNVEHMNLNQQAQAQPGTIQWKDWNWAGRDARNAATGGLSQQPQHSGVDNVSDSNQSVTTNIQQHQSLGLQENQNLLGQTQQLNQSQSLAQLQQHQTVSRAQQQTAPQHSQDQNQQTVNDQSAPIFGGMPLNALQTSLQIQTNAMPPNLPPQAHPFYLWMLQQQQAQQLAQAQQEAQRLAQRQAEEQARHGQEAQRIAQEQERMKQEEAKRQHDEAQRQQQEQAKSMRQQEEARQQQARQENQVRSNEIAAAASLNPQQLLSNANLNPQQQLAFFQYQLASAQAQQNGNGQLTLPQLQIRQDGDNFLVQQQLRLFQSLQQAQAQGLSAPSIQALAGTTSNFQPLNAGQPMLSPANQNNIATATPDKQASRTEKISTSHTSTNAVAPSHRSGVIGNTMKSLNNTMKSIHTGMPQQGALKSQSPYISEYNQANQQMISGSMKSLNSTLASTLSLPQQGVSQENATSITSSNYHMGNRKVDGQGTPMNTCTIHQANASTANSHSKLQAHHTASVTSGYLISSDTDGEFLARKAGKTDKYVTESGTDDDAMLLGVRAAGAATMEEKVKSKGAKTAVTGKTNKERNREHAKNTRLRKKAYVENLKQTVDELCKERDALVAERANAANILAETHSKRVDVLRSFFALRAGYSLKQKRELWSSILDESGFTCRLPVTPYQSFPSSEVQLSNCQRTISGVDAMIADVASNAVFLESLVDRYHHPMGKIKFQYTLVTEDSVTEGNQIMARWSMETLNARQCGARIELHQQGMLFCKFNSAHKIVALDIMFDVMAFMLQVKMAMGFENFNDVAIPNTVQTCQKQYDYPMVMTLADRPYTIVQVNERWENLTGYSGAEVVGKCSCSVLQGPDTGRKDLDHLMSPVMFKRPSCGMLTNYTKNKRRYRSYVTLYPLSTDSNVSHYFGLTTFVQWIDSEEIQSQQQRSNSGGDKHSSNNSSSGSSKRPRDSSASDPSLGTQRTKQAKTSENASPSCSDGTSTSAAVKVATAPNQGKQSLSSLTSSMSSSSTIEKRGRNQTYQSDPKECNDSVALLAPSRSKPAANQGLQKVEFSVPVANCPESTNAYTA